MMNDRPALEYAEDRYEDIKNPPEDNPYKSLDNVKPAVPKEENGTATMAITGEKYKISENGEYISID